jgi:hypothetical protein
LRPGPIKPPIAPSGPHPPKVTKVSTTSSSPQLHSTSPTTKPSNKVTETKKEDLKQAYIHGVLARPPPGAGKVATLWHQVKELFVRLTDGTQYQYLFVSRFRNFTLEASSWSSHIASKSTRFKRE